MYSFGKRVKILHFCLPILEVIRRPIFTIYLVVNVNLDPFISTENLAKKCLVFGPHLAYDAMKILATLLQHTVAVTVESQSESLKNRQKKRKRLVPKKIRVLDYWLESSRSPAKITKRFESSSHDSLIRLTTSFSLHYRTTQATVQLILVVWVTQSNLTSHCGGINLFWWADWLVLNCSRALSIAASSISFLFPCLLISLARRTETLT